MANHTASDAFQAIAIVNIAAHQGTLQERTVLGKELSDVLHHVGFVIITHHGLDDLMGLVFQESSQFFRLPVETKQQIDKNRSRHFRGWEPVGAESANGKRDWREQIDLWTKHEPSST